MEHPGLRGLSILVVENELLIALDIARALEDAGANATMTTTARHAMILADHDGLAGAIMDHGLNDGDSTAVCARLKKRGIPFSQPYNSAWIKGLMRSVRNGRQEQVIDHLICAALIEARSCEKFQLLARELASRDAELAKFYASLVESEGNHYATYLLMARAIDESETNRRLDEYLDLDATLMREPNPLPILH